MVIGMVLLTREGEFSFRIDKEKIIDYGNDDYNSPGFPYTVKSLEMDFILKCLMMS